MRAFQAVAATDTGRLRSLNQDLAVVSRDLVAIADGMGGHLGGEVAARVAIDALVDAFRLDRSTDGLIAAVEIANEAVWQRSREASGLRGMGTTLTAAALVGDVAGGASRVALVNIGDSRAYQVDPETGGLVQLTEDHSVVEEMVRSGDLTPAEAAVHPHRHVLTRALGIESGIEPDCWELDLDPGSRLLLCSDGLSNELAAEEIAHILLGEADPNAAAWTLVRAALSNGGSDNITVVVVDVGDAEPGSATDAESFDSLVFEPAGAVPAGAASGASSEPDVTGAVAVVGAGAAGLAGAAAARGPSGASPPLAGALGSVILATESVPLRTGLPRGTAAGTGAGKGSYGRPVVFVPNAKAPRPARDRVVTTRVVVFLILVVGIVGGTIGTVLWYNASAFFVKMDNGHVAIFQGRPAGVLWLRPTVVDYTALTAADLTPSSLEYLDIGLKEPSYKAAQALVQRLSLERSPSTSASSATSVPVTTTTLLQTTTTAGATTTTTGPATTTTTKPSPTTTTTTRPTPTTTTKPTPTTTTKPGPAGNGPAGNGPATAPSAPVAGPGSTVSSQRLGLGPARLGGPDRVPLR